MATSGSGGEQADSRRISVLFGLLFAAAALGNAAAAVALPAIARDLGVGVGLSAWTISLHALTMAVATAVYGRAMDLYGPRLPLVVGVLLMTGGAIAAALAPTYVVVVIARLVQGSGAAAVPAIGMAVLSARYEGASRAAALARLAALVGAATAAGAFIGGTVLAGLGWRAVIAIPALGAVLLPFLWSATRGRGTGARLDLPGALIVAVASGGVVLLLQSPSAGPGVALVGLFLVVLGVPAAIWWVRAHPRGFLPRGVITNPVVVRSSLGAAAVPAGWLGSQVAAPVLLVQEGWAPWQVGLVLLPSAGVAFLAPRLTGPVLASQGAFATLRLSSVVATLALGVAALGAALAGRHIAVAGALLLVGMALVTLAFGLSQPAVSAAVGDAAAPEERGVALGIASLVMLLGASLGAAVVGGVGPAVGIGWALALLALVPAVALTVVPRAPLGTFLHGRPDVVAGGAPDQDA